MYAGLYQHDADGGENMPRQQLPAELAGRPHRPTPTGLLCHAKKQKVILVYNRQAPSTRCVRWAVAVSSHSPATNILFHLLVQLLGVKVDHAATVEALQSKTQSQMLIASLP